MPEELYGFCMQSLRSCALFRFLHWFSGRVDGVFCSAGLLDGEAVVPGAVSVDGCANEMADAVTMAAAAAKVLD